jgi:predicted DNA-binding protein
VRPNLKRMSITIEPETRERLVDLAERLTEETGDKYEVRAVVRGLINIALTRLELELLTQAPLATWFAGSRVKRGRKRQGAEPPREVRIMPL